MNTSRTQRSEKPVQSLVKYGPLDSRTFMDPSFPGATAVNSYWSSTSRFAVSSQDAWAVNFDSGSVYSVLIWNKPAPLPARAVRGGR
jgi:hypothetical protein